MRDTMRKKLVAIVAAIGIALAAVSVAIVGTGAFAADKGPNALGTPDPSSSISDTAVVPTSDTLESPTAAPVDAGQAAFDALIDQCMANQGYAADIAQWREQDFKRPAEESTWYQSHSEEQRTVFELALWGNSGTGAPWRWEDTGCDGYAEHTLGLEASR